jgi:hypothetical protein
MKNEDFNVILKARLLKITKTLSSKAEEYADEGDRLHNFKAVAMMDEGETPERALKGMWKKHLVSVFDIINDLDYEVLPTVKCIDEKLGDAINYLILLEALIIERINKE